jgi:CheY-like chemotaxis protein
VVEEAASAIRTMFEDKGLSLEIRLPPNLPDLNADRTRLRQILINLLNNAARHTSHGGASVGGAADEHEVVIWVTDTGAGIPADDLPHVFDEFYQVAGPRWRRATGLGLTISKRFVELHGGSMWVESRAGDGSTFYFSLPLAASVVAVPSRDDWQTWVLNPDNGQLRGTVAVLDEDPEVVQLFQRYLDRYRVVGAPSLAKARQLAGTRPLHALVVANGVTTESCRDGVLATIPVVSCPLRSGRTISRSLGVVQYLSKPISRQQVRDVLLGLGRGIRDVLVVDDDPEMVRLLARMVQSGHRARNRYSVRTTTDSREAIEAMRERRPDLVFLDLLMPGLDGYAVLDEMRLDERLRDVPVVLVTAKGIDESMVASELRISRAGGLPVGEVIGCLQASLGVLIGAPAEHNALEPSGAPGA